MNSYRSRKSKAGISALGLALIGLLLLAGGRTSYAAPQTPPASDADASEVVPGGSANEADAQLAMPTDQVIVKYRTLITKQDTFAPAGAAEMQRLSDAAGVQLTYEREMSGDAYVMSLPARLPLAEVQAIADSLSALPEVEYAEPDAIMVPMLTPNDPQYVNQWHYFAPSAGRYGINAPAAWDITTGSSSVVVAVIDTGITNHSEFVSRTIPGYDFISEYRHANDGDGRDSDPSDPGDWITSAESAPGSYFKGCPVTNSSWHGTHTAGTIGAASNNNTGVAGVNWSSKILPVRVMGKCGGTLSDIADGMRWAAGLTVPGVPANANPAKVINMSLGGAGACEATVQAAINAITAVGTTIMVSAGNNTADASGFQPASCNGVITVAATNRNGGIAWYSNFGAVVEISAPGGETNVLGTDGVLSTLNDGAQGPGADIYAYYQGTSMAAPHVAGVASLLYSLKPSLTPAEVSAILQNTVTVFPGGSSCTISNCGRGIVNAGAAVAVFQPTITGFNPPLAASGGPGFTLTVNGKGFMNGSVVQWNGSSRATTYISSTQLTAAITAGDIVATGTAPVTVANPAPSGVTSGAMSFAVVNPVPVITWLSPFWAAPGGPDFTLTVNGTGFINSSVVRWNGTSLITTPVNSIQLKVQIAAADIVNGGSESVTVFNPTPGGGESNAMSFFVGIPKIIHLPLVTKNYVPPPAAPVLNAIANTDGDGSYTVGWNAVAGATSYTLEEDDNGGFASPTVVADHVTSTSWLASGKTLGTYFYRVKATSPNGDSAWSNGQSAQVPPPAVPVLNPIANAAGDAIYTVSWNAAARAASYTLEEDDNIDFTSPTTQYAGAGVSWSATCSPVGPHYYRVRANNGVGSSGWSNVQSTVVQNVIRNPGFECGTASWQEFSSNYYSIIVYYSDLPSYAGPHGGNWAAWEAGLNDEVSWVQQTVGVSYPYLVYWHWIDSEDPTCGHDFAGVLVNGNVVDQYDLCVSSNTGGWVKHVVNLGAYVGQTVQLQIRTETDSTFNSNLFVDDVTLQPTAAAEAAVTRAPGAADWQMKSTQFAPRPDATPAGSPERLFGQASSSAR